MRIANEKSHCVIIEFIGNYRNADVKLQVFTDDCEQAKALTCTAFNLPETCTIELGITVINLLEAVKRKSPPRKQQLIEVYLALKTELSHKPSYLDYHLKANTDSRAIKQEFGSFAGMLAYTDKSNEEKTVFEAYRIWLQEVNGTRMTKSYTMVVLKYMLSRGIDNWLNPITAEEATPFFHQYLTVKDQRLHVDFSEKQGKDLRLYYKKKIAVLIARMPMTKWSGSSKGLISYEDGLLMWTFWMNIGLFCMNGRKKFVRIDCMGVLRERQMLK